VITPKPCRLARHAGLRWRVAQKLALHWSPKQISGWLKRQFPVDQGMQVSHETIYRSLFIQTRGVLKKQLRAHLRTARQMRQAKGGTTKSGLGQIIGTQRTYRGKRWHVGFRREADVRQNTISVQARPLRPLLSLPRKEKP
jgi:IS30 family transposase